MDKRCYCARAHRNRTCGVRMLLSSSSPIAALRTKLPTIEATKLGFARVKQLEMDA